MKKILTPLLVVALLATVATILLSMAKKDSPIVIVVGNLDKKPLPIKLNKTNDTQCAMLIKSEKNAAEVIDSDGRTWFFDDPGCMVLWLKDKKWKDKATLWVHTIDTNRWIKANDANFGVTDHSEMHYGFGARERGSSKTISFKQMQLRVLRGETMANPKWRKKLLSIKQDGE